MAEHFKRPSVTVDIVVENKNNQILLVRRAHHPFKDYWALPGGFLEVEKETCTDAAKRELKEETGLVVHLKDLQLFGESSNPKRDPRGHIVSLHYAVRNYQNNAIAGDDAAAIKWWRLDSLPPLAFDHAEILDKYMDFRREKYGK